MSDEEDDDLGIVGGTVIESVKQKFVVQKLLGEGGFGAVYKVNLEGEERKCFAMKVEKKIDTRRHSKLKMEIAILKLVSAERKQSHFTKMIDRGKKDTYFFIVMELVGPSLADLKAMRPEKVFSQVTGLGCGLQCLEACEDLHKHGYIHRDLKPANYAIGLEDKRRTVYILDFGIARKFVNAENELKTPRSAVRFKGTIRFASIACHKGEELGPKDDCESWMYLLLDLTVITGHPWKKLSDKTEVQKAKEDARKGEKRDILFNSLKCKSELSSILSYIDDLRYHQRPDYKYIYGYLSDGIKTCGGTPNDPYDWEDSAPAPSKLQHVTSGKK